MKDARKVKNPEAKGERQKELESPEHLGEEAGLSPGRSGGNLARDVGTREHQKRSFERPISNVRPEKAAQETDGDHGKT